MELPVLDLTTQTAEIGPDEFVLSVHGEVDMYSAPQLEEALDALLDCGAVAIVVDLRPLIFLDSNGMGVISSAVKRSRATGGSVAIACDAPNVLRVLTVSGLNRFVPVRSSLSAAIDDVRGGSG